METSQNHSVFRRCAIVSTQSRTFHAGEMKQDNLGGKPMAFIQTPEKYPGSGLGQMQTIWYAIYTGALRGPGGSPVGETGPRLTIPPKRGPCNVQFREL